jgi:toxin secretion/phage lysis holin
MNMDKIQNYFDQLKAFVFGVLLYLQIDKEIAMILMILICADMVCGGAKAMVIPDIKFSFKTFYAGIIRKSLLLIIIMVLALISKGLGFTDFKLMVTIVIKAMILSEGISVFNNIRSVFDKKEHKSTDFISEIIGKISNYLQFYMNKIMKFFDNDADCGKFNKDE